MHKAGRSFLTAAALAAVAITAQAQSMMTHHVRDAVRNGQVQSNGRLPATQMMNLDIVLPVRNQAGLDQFVEDVYNPQSTSYHHFLTPQQFTAKFGPTQADYDAVLQFAQMNGFTVTGGTRDGMDVQVRGTVSQVENAFHVRMQTYKHPTENRNFYSPDQEPTTDLSFNLWHVTGLENYSLPHPLVESKAAYAAEHGIDVNKVVSQATTGSGPSASFLGSDMRAAYYGSGSLTGAGQNLGLLEYAGTDLADLQTYYKNVGQTYPGNIITLLSTDGTSTSCTEASGSCDDTEQTLDMTQALGMAPGLASMTMYVGSSDTAILSAMTTHSPLPTTIGCSWGWTPADPSTLNPYFEKMASQGQSFFTASGDHSTWTKTGNSEAWPGDNAYVITVGGTDLVTSSAAGPWQSETAWADSGGGISPDSVTIPSWQQYSGVINSSNRGSTTLRNGPDVSANANFTFYTCADQTSCLANSYGGTSFAAPMWAGYIALVNQQLAANSQPSVGFLNPTIYQNNAGSASYYAANFHDVTSGTSGSYSAVTGYDLVTGWGSPTPALVSALTGTQTQTPDFTIAGTAATAKAGSTGTSTITIGAIDGFNSSVSLAASNVPSGVTVAFNPTSVTGSGNSTATFTVGSSVAAGNYSITVTGTSGSTTHSTTVTLTVSSSTQSSYTISASPKSLTVTRGTSSNVTVTLTGTTTGAVTFTASGMSSGETISFSPSSLSGAGSTTMKITAASRATRTTKTITVKASGGGTSATATVSVTVH